MFDGIKNLLSALVIAAPVRHFGINVPQRDGKLGLTFGLQALWRFDLVESGASRTFEFVAALGVGP